MTAGVLLDVVMVVWTKCARSAGGLSTAQVDQMFIGGSGKGISLVKDGIRDAVVAVFQRVQVNANAVVVFVVMLLLIQMLGRLEHVTRAVDRINRSERPVCQSTVPRENSNDSHCLRHTVALLRERVDY